ncbi:histidinol-phosphatase HisJ [Paenibacillus yanchengensis]|uniref:Histidinol-phosphatase n=1 Tax=Paenibacillus yanchengensis TaxID=2035833 RepID=A0ABW4YH14_9BACL
MYILIKWDGHTHTKFCYHGSDAAQELYINRAIALGFERYTISEHISLPDHYIDDAQLMAELAMPEQELEQYFAYAADMKQRFADQIEVTVGLEVDYLPDHADYTNRILDKWHNSIEDVVYSVHYLPGVGGMRCIDFTPDDFKRNILAHYGTMEKLVDEYYNHVEQAIMRAAKLPIRTRIGHLNLIEKFSTTLPSIDDAQTEKRLRSILELLEGTKVAVDVNTAGLRVPTCGKAYVPAWFLAECRKRNIACVYGSDSHKPEQVGFGYDYFEQFYLQK